MALRTLALLTTGFDFISISPRPARRRALIAWHDATKHQRSPGGANRRFPGKLCRSTFAIRAILRAARAILRDADTVRKRRSFWKPADLAIDPTAARGIGPPRAASGWATR